MLKPLIGPDPVFVNPPLILALLKEEAEIHANPTPHTWRYNCRRVCRHCGRMIDSWDNEDGITPLEPAERARGIPRNERLSHDEHRTRLERAHSKGCPATAAEEAERGKNSRKRCTIEEGWAFPDGARKWHYFGESFECLCGRFYVPRGSAYLAFPSSGTECSTCLWRLLKDLCIWRSLYVTKFSAVKPCRSCEKPIEWWRTSTDRNIPIDADTTRIRMRGETYIRTRESFEAWETTAHWMTCPDTYLYRGRDPERAEFYDSLGR